MEPVSYQSRPSLSRPVLIAAFQGWNDAGEAASIALRYLEKAWNTQSYATIDPEEFYDFTVRRPQVRINEEGEREIQWPSNTFSHVSLPSADRDVILLDAVEPSIRWKAYSKSIVDVAIESGAELFITLGALLSPIPHTWPVPVTATSTDPDLARSLGFGRSRYEGPTGIVGVIHESMVRARIPSASLWAQIPIYLQNNPSPRAALEILRRLEQLLGFGLETEELERAANAYEEEVTEAVESDPEVLAQVAELEREAREAAADIPTGDELAAELERYLKDLRGDA